MSIDYELVNDPTVTAPGRTKILVIDLARGRRRARQFWHFLHLRFFFKLLHLLFFHLSLISTPLRAAAMSIYLLASLWAICRQFTMAFFMDSPINGSSQVIKQLYRVTSQLLQQPTTTSLAYRMKPSPMMFCNIALCAALWSNPHYLLSLTLNFTPQATLRGESKCVDTPSIMLPQNSTKW